DIKIANKYAIKKSLTEVEKGNMELSNIKDEYFFRIWSLKEAFIKCLGEGLSYGMKNVEFNISNKYENIICNVRGFKFKQEKISINNKEYIISVAWEVCNG
ncbi:4'-phosphopantetheinyl transferase family protein, partial [Clostridium cuniculi]